MLQVQDLHIQYGQHTVVENAGFSLKEHQWLMIVGPNGAGKSTMIHAITGEIPYHGQVLLHGKDIAKMKPAQKAKQIAVLQQNYHVTYAFTVEEIVRFGRYAHHSGLFRTTTPEDDVIVNQALEHTGMLPLKAKSVLSLSGGELQRTFLAQVLAQQPQLLILDEPTNHLDLIYQKEIFALLSDWVNIPGHAIISVVHDLSLALRYGTHALLLNKGDIIAQGNVREVLTKEYLQQVYGMDIFDWMHQLLSLWKKNENGSTDMQNLKSTAK